MAEKLVPGDPIPLARIAELLWGSMQGRGRMEMIGLDLRGEFRSGGEVLSGSVSGGSDHPWKLYLKDAWEYRYLTDREIEGLRVRRCERIVAMFRESGSGKMFQGRIRETQDGLEWRMAEMIPEA